MNDSRNYKKYKNKNPLMHLVISNFLNQVKKNIDSVKVDSILDAGCGEGFTLRYLNINNANGVDISKSAIKIAKSLNPKCKFKEGSIYKLPFEKNSFDLVMALEVLEHLEEPQKAIDEVKRVSKRYCIFSVPNEPWFRMMNLLRCKNISRLGNDVEHVQNWSSKEFLKLIEKEFNIISVRKPFPWTLVFCKK